MQALHQCPEKHADAVPLFFHTKQKENSDQANKRFVHRLLLSASKLFHQPACPEPYGEENLFRVQNLERLKCLNRNRLY